MSDENLEVLDWGVEKTQEWGEAKKGGVLALLMKNVKSCWVFWEKKGGFWGTALYVGKGDGWGQKRGKKKKRKKKGRAWGGAPQRKKTRSIKGQGGKKGSV